ncbi:MAG: DNA gyrase inhibitor YacG [Deferrisomatales bacterium]|nr:DNA gyrase inhibitor YacG [Deferrisomatales bacterium]
MEIRCPTCRARVVWEQSPHRPFCSERCKAVDLGRWLAEDYRVPVWDEADGAPDGDAPPDLEKLC